MASLDNNKYREGKKFPKEERLKSKKVTEELFDKGSSVYLYPYRIFFLPGPPSDPYYLPSILISIPKRLFKKAVDRNRLRRQIKEAYRLHRKEIFQNQELEKIPSSIAILYTAKEKIPFKKLEEKLILILKRLKN